MKKYILFLLLVLSLSCFAIKPVEYKANLNLIELSEKSEIPVKKWIQYLELPQGISSKSTLKELKLNQNKLDNAYKLYEENQSNFYVAMVIVGMLIVFTSLIITGLVISQLEHFSKKKSKKKTKTVKTKIGKITGQVDHISSNAIVAAITAIYLHELEVEEQNKLLLTWKRAPLSVWKTAKLMPNNNFFNTIKR